MSGRALVAATAVAAAVISAGTATVAPSVAHAGNEDSVLVGNGAAMTGGAVTATVGEGSALFYNPAGLGHVTTNTADITAQAIGFRYYAAPELITATDGRASDESTVEILTIPSALSYVRPISEHFVLGLGIFVPQASDITLRNNLRDETGDATGEVQFAITDTSANYEFSLGAAWRPASNFRLGLTAMVGYNTTFAVVQFFAAAESPEERAFGGISDTISQKLFDVQLRAGLQWEPTDRLSLGLSIWSPGMVLAGYSRITAAIAAAGMGPDGADLGLSTVDNGEFDAQFERHTPGRIQAGVAYDFDRFHLAVDGGVISPLSNPNFGIDQAAIWNLRVGGIYHINPDMHFGVGLSTDRGGDTVNGFGSAAADFYGGTVGLHTEHHVGVSDEDEDADEIVFSTFLALRYAVGVGEIGGIRFTPEDPEALLQERPVDLTVHELFLHIGSSVVF